MYGKSSSRDGYPETSSCVIGLWVRVRVRAKAYVDWFILDTQILNAGACTWKGAAFGHMGKQVEQQNYTSSETLCMSSALFGLLI